MMDLNLESRHIHVLMAEPCLKWTFPKKTQRGLDYSSCKNAFLGGTYVLWGFPRIGVSNTDPKMLLQG